MSREATLWLLFGGFFLAPIAMAFLLALLAHLLRLCQLPRPPAAAPPEELSAAGEFGCRRLRFRRWAGGGCCAAIAAYGLDLPLSALGLAVLLPLYGALAHLRCPACDTTPSLRGSITVHGACWRCGVRLR